MKLKWSPQSKYKSVQLICTRRDTYLPHTEGDQTENLGQSRTGSINATVCNGGHLHFMSLHTENKKSLRSKDSISAYVRGTQDILVMKLWCLKQPDLIFRGRNEVLRLRTLTPIHSLSFYLSSVTRAYYGKMKKMGREKKNTKTLTQCSISHYGQALFSSCYLCHFW